MKNHRQYENRVKQNAIIIFLLAVSLCGGMIYYIINAKQSINEQRDLIKKNEDVLSLTNSFIEKINKAQSYANLYTLSGNSNHLNNFKIITAEIPNLNDSIISLCDEDFNTKTLNDIIVLLQKKEKNIEAISEQLNTFNPYLEIYSIINNYQHIQNNTTVSKTIQDTIIYKTEKKNFFKRLSEVFNPDNSLDSIVLLSQTTIDTISINDDATELLLNELQITTEKGRKNYIKQIETFERKYNNLTLADQEITKEISDLLINLHKYTLNSVIKEIQKSEIIINRNINVSILIAGIALLTILIFIFFIFYDIKKVVIARKATEEAKKRTEEIMESRHKLLLSVSHDIKSPLSSILGYLELMGMDSHDKEEKRKITSMKNSADHILSLLTNLLNFSKLDQGKESIITSEFNISKLCDELSEMFASLAKNKQLTFIYKKDIDENLFVKSDALKIKQILSNILSNAIKYTIKGKVHFIVSKDENSMTFNISDEGIGIPQDKLEEIFKPFSRIDNNESLIEGSGFGLFVVKGLIDLLNGKINVNSEVGKGSNFTIRIPVAFIEIKEIKEENIDINELKSGFKLNILVIDDDKTLLTVIESMLNKLDIKCDKCQSSIEFDNALKNINYYDLILTDREMGAFSGLDVLKKVKEINTDKKVVLMTARSEYNKDIAVEKGFDDYLRKPFSVRELASLLDTNFHSETTNNSRYQNDFPDLCSMFDNDDDITEILNTFVESTVNNIVIFNEIINDDNFTEAVSLCHKMRPMFVQLNQNECADFLLKMDMLRGRDESSFPEWKEKAIEFMSKVDDLISYLYEKYGIE
ncbi:MAG: hybrid sensor histidine kinase/response regulator [Bacteroidales bacterium]|nr:hybrid sensor histidine kinase/response regulator [Bacteroidales bacterium]